MNRNPLLLTPLLALLLVGSAVAKDDTAMVEGIYQLQGTEDGGKAITVRLVVGEGDGTHYPVLRSARCGKALSVQEGRGELVRTQSGLRLRVRFGNSQGMAGAMFGTREETEDVVAIYAIGWDSITGVFRGPSCAGGNVVWTEEHGHAVSRPEGDDRERDQAASTTSDAAAGGGNRSGGGGASGGSSQVDRLPQPERLPPDGALGAERPPVDGLTLEALLAATVRSAQRELAADVREIPRGSNRGERIDIYAATAGMPLGGAWCGYFAGYNYTVAARSFGRSFNGQMRLHSVGKCRSYFLYRSFTQTSTAERIQRWEAEREAHSELGAARRFFVLRGSRGDRYARARGLSHEVFERYQDLPVGPGDTVLWEGHIGLVESYDAGSGRLVTLEGNTGNRVQRKSYDLSDRRQRAAVQGFGRPALGDFVAE